MKTTLRIGRIVLGMALAGALLLGATLRGQEKPDRKPTDEDQHNLMSLRPMRITVEVVGEDGKPVSQADVRINVYDPLFYIDQYNKYTGKSSSDGKFSVESKCLGWVDIWITKPGFYGSGREYMWRMNDYDPTKNTDEAIKLQPKPLQPWNPVVRLTLRRMVRPIPMIVRGTAQSDSGPLACVAPAFDMDLEWDMFESKWLPPHGKGKVADLILRFTKATLKDESVRWTMDVRFANRDDGLIPIRQLTAPESLLKYPYTAPADGYALKSYRTSVTEGKEFRKIEPSDPPLGYFIRLRSKVDGNGKVISANYGKIVSDSVYHPRFQAGEVPVTHPIGLGYWVRNKPGSLCAKMKYLINPTPNDLNIEWDWRTSVGTDGARPQGGFFP